MKTSRNLTRLFVALATLIALCAVSFAQASRVQVSDQKAGSLLVFPFYGNDGAGGDTRLTITNVGEANGNVNNQLNVHLFFLDASCSQADVYLCFTKFQSYSFKASEWDPVTARGELIAVPVDAMGAPITYNGLIGNAFVNTTVSGAKWVGNYSPEAFTAVGAVTGVTTTATLNLNNAPLVGGAGYDAPAGGFAAEFQSPVDVKNQAILTMGLNGTIGGALNGNAAAGIAAIYRNDEKLFSYSMPGSGCSALTIINDATIRIVGGLSNSIGTGKTGTAIWNVAGAVGLFVTPVQANNASQGIRTLHKRTAGNASLTIPVFMPIC